MRRGDEEFHRWYAPGGMGRAAGARPSTRATSARTSKRSSSAATCAACSTTAAATGSGPAGSTGERRSTSAWTSCRRSWPLCSASTRGRGSASRPWTPTPGRCPPWTWSSARTCCSTSPTGRRFSLVRRFEASARWVLYCNDLPLACRPINDDTVRGGFRRVDLSKPPFSVRGRHVFHFSTEPDGKAVFLWSREAHPR